MVLRRRFRIETGRRGHLDILDAVLTTVSVLGFWSVFEKLLGDFAKRFKA